MKSIFSICRIFSFCFFVVIIFSSCKSYLMVDGKQVPKKATIYVSGYTPGNGQLTLKDASGQTVDPFPAFPGQKIRWKLTDPRHHKIDTLYEKPAYPNPVFEKDPHPVFLSKSWKGIIKDPTALQEAAVVKDATGTSTYIYSIVWDDGGPHYTFDPRIQIQIQIMKDAH